ncbi:MAG: GNAT family N-acetyltransferase [Rhodobacteraceae bacterium]|nr:GNAT family N-acetyltransferase [Paracoccaceae bacterium]
MKQEKFIGQLVIETKRFHLRPIRMSDQGLIELFSGDERVARMTSTFPYPLPPGATEAYLKRVTAADRDQDVWAIDGSAAGERELLGLITLHHVTEYQSEITYWIAPQFWNSGLASEAVDALVLANPLGCTSMVASIFQDNPASAKVITNAGFELIGESETFSVARNGMVDTWDYVLRLAP